MYTLKDAFKDGYRLCEIKTQKGYCTRKKRLPEQIEVFFAGGNRKGQLYYLMPSLISTRYCLRMYLRKEGN